MTPDELASVIAHANELVWKQPNLDVLRAELRDDYPLLVQQLEGLFKKSQSRGSLQLPNMRAYGNNSVAVFSDYSGEGAGRYDVYSFLVACWGLTAPFAQEMSSIRSRRGLGDLEIMFKRFGMGVVLNSIPDYLEALDKFVPGLLFTLIVDKRVRTLFGPPERVTLQRLTKAVFDSGLGDRKPHVAEKLVRVVHTAAFLVGLLAHDGQNILWMTDKDEIVANDTFHEQTPGLAKLAVG